jgi:hypothetical protein
MKPGSTFGVKTTQGAIIPVLDAGTQRRNRVLFTTTVDRQRLAYFEIYHRIDGQWQAIDILCLHNIPPQKAGEPDLEFEACMLEPDKLSLKVTAPDREIETVELKLNLDALAAGYPRRAGKPKAVPELAPKSGCVSGRRRSSRKRFYVLGPLLLVLLFAAALMPFFLRKAGRIERALAAAAADAPEIAPYGAAGPPQQKRSPDVPEAVAAQNQKQEVPGEIVLPSEGRGESPPQPEEYLIMWGDTLWRIAERYYGNRDLYGKLAESNNLADPDRILAGKTLKLLPEVNGIKRSEFGGAELAPQQSR